MKKKKSELVNTWIRPDIINMSSYSVAKADHLIKLDAMENPYPLPPTLIKLWLDKLQSAELNRYPPASAEALITDLKKTLEVPDDASVLLGNGSDELIQIVALSLARPGRVIMAPKPSFVMYEAIAHIAGMQYYGVPLKPNFDIDCQQMLECMERMQPAVVFIANPNNPTANLFSQKTLLKIIKNAPGLVVIDEAYAPFTDQTFFPYLDQFNNLLVMRTLSKMGLAGLRLGLLAGDASWIEQLNKIRMPYNINSLTQLSARFAMSHYDVFVDQLNTIIRNREKLTKQLQSLPDLQVYPSKTNFILFRVNPGCGQAVFDSIKQSGVLIKNLQHADSLLHDCLRVTVGTADENSVFISALKIALQKH